MVAVIRSMTSPTVQANEKAPRSKNFPHTLMPGIQFLWCKLFYFGIAGQLKIVQGYGQSSVGSLTIEDASNLVTTVWLLHYQEQERAQQLLSRPWRAATATIDSPREDVSMPGTLRVHLFSSASLEAAGQKNLAKGWTRLWNTIEVGRMT
jgi:hypothetical protein